MSSPYRSTLLRLTTAKSVASMGVRWVPAFLPTLERAFGATTGQLTAIMGLAEASGLSTVIVGRQLDRGKERIALVGSLCVISLSSIVAAIGSLLSFAIGFVFLLAGVANMTVASHAWISKRVAYEGRARSIGTFELGWAFALLIGGPVAAVLINLVGWRGPFVFVGIAAAACAVLVAATIPADQPATAADPAVTAATTKRRIPGRAWLVIAGYAFVATAGLSTFVVTGTWLEESFGVSTGGLGTIALGLGVFELIASGGSAAFADRLGKHRSTLIAEIVLCVGLVVMVIADESLVVGVIGLLLLLLGFEYAIVTSFSLVSEAMPEARGRILAMSQAVGTGVRGLGVVLSGWLFDRYGINGTALLAAAATFLSFSCYSLSRR